jgi:hypothetical protein
MAALSGLVAQESRKLLSGEQAILLLKDFAS